MSVVVESARMRFPSMEAIEKNDSKDGRDKRHWNVSRRNKIMKNSERLT